METFCYEVGREFDLCSKTDVDLFPSFDVSEVHPELRLGDEYEFRALPETHLSPEIEETVEGEDILTIEPMEDNNNEENNN